MSVKKCPLLRMAREINTDCRGEDCAFYYQFCYKVSEPKINVDRIKNMTVEELAEFMIHGCDIIEQNESECLINPEGKGDCRQCWVKWLKRNISDSNS